MFLQSVIWASTLLTRYLMSTNSNKSKKMLNQKPVIDDTLSRRYYAIASIFLIPAAIILQQFSSHNISEWLGVDIRYFAYALMIVGFAIALYPPQRRRLVLLWLIVCLLMVIGLPLLLKSAFAH